MTRRRLFSQLVSAAQLLEVLKRGSSARTFVRESCGLNLIHAGRASAAPKHRSIGSCCPSSRPLRRRGGQIRDWSAQPITIWASCLCSHLLEQQAAPAVWCKLHVTGPEFRAIRNASRRTSARLWKSTVSSLKPPVALECFIRHVCWWQNL